jgi:hypothetical protein
MSASAVDRRRGGTMKLWILSMAIVIAVLSIGVALQGSVRVDIPSQNPGPPFYALIERLPGGEIFQDGQWAAIPFLRDPVCVPAAVDLLDGFDRPRRSVSCGLTVHGFAIYKNGPSIDPVPVYAFTCGRRSGSDAARFASRSRFSTA